MRDFLYVSFFLGHDSGDAARDLLRKCALLEHAERRKENRHSWLDDIHLGVSVRLPTSFAWQPQDCWAEWTTARSTTIQAPVVPAVPVPCPFLR